MLGALSSGIAPFAAKAPEAVGDESQCFEGRRGKMLYRVKDFEAYEKARLIRKMLWARKVTRTA